MEKYFYSYDELIKDLKILTKDLGDYKPDAIIALSRGGVTIGHFLAEYFDIRTLYTMNTIHYDGQKKMDEVIIYNIPDIKDAKKVLIVDEIIDSGETIQEVMKVLNKRHLYVDFKTLTVFQKKRAVFKADYWVKDTDKWIEFFWELALK
ncbi:MAG: phosphoribosyltransferase family protein [Campylobacterales bacterium]|nr:phosphoribosyltransferase family protein [Campylobacterales bacterium]